MNISCGKKNRSKITENKCNVRDFFGSMWTPGSNEDKTPKFNSKCDTIFMLSF